MIALQAPRHNKHSKINNKSIYFFEISGKGVSWVGHLFNESQKWKIWNELKKGIQFSIFSHVSLLHANLKAWKKDLPAVKETIDNFITQYHHLVRKHHIYFLNRKSSKKSYNILISKRKNNILKAISSRKVQR